MTIHDLATPALLIESSVLEGNLQRMQRQCDAAGVELWPHAKTHKMVEVLRQQLALGAKGATCAKIGEAEALLPSGVKRIFIAHSLVDPAAGPRLAALQSSLDELLLAVTSLAHFRALESLLRTAGLHVPVLLAVDSGLHREGVRTHEQAIALAGLIRDSAHMDLIGLYSHEGHAYQPLTPNALQQITDDVYAILTNMNQAIGGELSLWPGCSVTASFMMEKAGVKAIRPGAYVFGDLFLAEVTGVMSMEATALTVYATVVDLPEPGLALIDAGSKVFSGDKTPQGLSGRCVEFPSLEVSRVSEEHGFLTGPGVDDLKVGQRLRFVPAHICAVVNLADRVRLVHREIVEDTWRVDARGRSD